MGKNSLVIVHGCGLGSVSPGKTSPDSCPGGEGAAGLVLWKQRGEGVRESHCSLSKCRLSQYLTASSVPPVSKTSRLGLWDSCNLATLRGEGVWGGSPGFIQRPLPCRAAAPPSPTPPYPAVVPWCRVRLPGSVSVYAVTFPCSCLCSSCCLSSPFALFSKNIKCLVFQFLLFIIFVLVGFLGFLLLERQKKNVC